MTTLTYREFGARVAGLAAGLRALGVGLGDRVAILMQNGHRYLECYFGVPSAGAILVPLNNRHAVAEQRSILEDAGETDRRRARGLAPTSAGRRNERARRP